MPSDRRRVLTAWAAALCCGWLTGCSGMNRVHHREHAVACRQCAAGAPCPARPAHFGYYATQWRHWPDAGGPGPSTTGTTTPAAPPRSVVPHADEESPRSPPPTSDAVPGSDAVGAAARRITTIAAEATAVEAASPARQAEFTQRLAERLVVEHDPLVRARIVEAASTFNTPSAAAICAGALSDPDPQVRVAGCDAWARRGGPAAVPLIAARFDGDGELAVRLRALHALGTIHDQAATAVLVRALDDPDPAVRLRAMGSLRQHAGRDLGADPETWKAWAANPRGFSSPWAVARELLQSVLR